MVYKVFVSTDRVVTAEKGKKLFKNFIGVIKKNSFLYEPGIVLPIIGIIFSICYAVYMIMILR